MTTKLEILAAAVVQDPRWTAVLRRDAKADGRFFYSVRTTGVYCRPSCAARVPRPENVAFHSSAVDAERLGFRPCKRCRPTEPSFMQARATKIAELCRWIDDADHAPDLRALAHHAGLSTYHLHRTFKAITGLTPKAYAAARRAERMRNELSRSRTVTEAIYRAGYQSNGRFYEESESVLGMTPKSYQMGGAGTSIRFAVESCSLGWILVATTAQGVCTILMGDDPDELARDLRRRFARAEIVSANAELQATIAKVVAYVEAPQVGLDLPLDIRGTAFQERVWQALRDIPAGTTASYTEIAKRIGSPKSVRAVARACSANPLAVAIPCHRIVRSDATISGYAWGVERKRELLRREGYQQDRRTPS